MNIYPGACHIHSIHSDGTGSIEEIALAAKRAGLSWIIITDHNNMDAKEGYYEGVTVIVGEEISPDTENHYLALGIKEPISCNMPASEYIYQTKSQGGIGFVAHPDEQTNRQNSYPALRWTDWNLRGFDGIELWNYMSDWVDGYNAKDIAQSIKSLLFRNNVLTGPTPNTLKWWDELNNETAQIIPAIGGVDVHAMKFKKKFLEVEIFPYKDCFDTITNFLHFDEELPNNFQERKQAILHALKEGRNIIANRVWMSKDKIPLFLAQNASKKVFSGQKIELDEYTSLITKIPKRAEIRLFYDGQLIWNEDTNYLEFNKLDKGKYRLEIYYQNRPWIFTNPILIY